MPAVQDVTINSLAGSNADENQLYVGYREGYGVSRVLMKFPGLILADVLDSKKIISANVRLYNNSPSHAPIKAIAYMFTGNEWEEETVTWTNVNANSYTHFLSQNRINTTHMWYTFDILDYIKCCIDSPTAVGQGILFRAEDSVEAAGVTNYNRFASFNHLDPNKRPVITVEYDNSNSDNARPFGWFDTVTDTYASGWAWCVDAPDEACTVRVEMTNNSTGQVFVKECIANRPRPDVAQAGYDSGNYGFYCTLDWSECTPGQYTVRAIAIAPGGSRSDPNDCYELLSAKSYTVAGYAEVVPSGTFYLNNREYGRYLKNTNGAADAQSGLLADLGTSIQWILTEFSDGYVLQNLGDTNQMLAVPAGYTSDSVLLSAPDVLGTYNYVWDIVLASNGCFLKSRYNNRYLYIDGGGHLKTRVDAGDCFFDQSTGEVTDTTADACWRIVSIDEYGSSSNYSSVELSSDFSMNGMTIDVNEVKKPTVCSEGENFLWVNSYDFIYSYSHSLNPIEIDNERSTITALKRYDCTVTAVHKVTGYANAFNISVDSSLPDVLENLQILFNIANSYYEDISDSSALMLALQFIRRGYYNDYNWNTVAGTIDASFVAYVQANNPDIYNYFTVLKEGDLSAQMLVRCPSGLGEIDFVHLCAVLNGLLYDSTGFKAFVVGESSVDDLCGWAGDLQTLVKQVLIETNYSNDAEEIYNRAYLLLGAESETDSYFSMSDLLADTDAYNIWNIINVSNPVATFTSYYSTGIETRFTDFTNGWTKSEIYVCARYYTDNEFFLMVDWPLLREFEVSVTQADAVASAFTDYIWERIQDEKGN